MKKFLLYAMTVLLLASIADLQAQPLHNWSWSFPQPVGQTLRWCKMWDANNWYAVGYGGNFIKTTNAGATWDVTGPAYLQWRGDNASLYDAHFFNMNTGIIAGYRGLWKTTNAGTTWDTLAVNPPSSLYGLQFLNNNTGFTCGSSGYVQKTTDGGTTWTDIHGSLTVTCYSIYAFDANNILIGESSGDIWRTTNGGTTWTEMLLPGGSMYRINFFDANTGFAVGSSTTIKLSTNAGANWTTITSGIPSSTFYDIDFGPAGPPTGLAEQQFTGTTFPPAGWRTVNVLGTNQWVRYTTYYHSTPASARISYQSTGGEDWLITPQINVGSGDSLVFWARKYYSSTYDPDSLVVRVSTTDTAITSFTNIIGEYNVNSFGTTTWNRIAIPLGSYAGNAWVAFQHWNNDGNGLMLDDISVGLNSGPPPPTVYVTGNPFAIYKSADLGNTWDTVGFTSSEQTVTSTYYATSLGGNGDSLLTVGAFGFINKRNSASDRHTFRPDWTWFTSTLNAVEVLGNRVMIPTSYSTILSTTNGGNDWDTSRVNYSYSGTLYSISKVNNSTAWVAGSNGRAYYTTDGGATWTGSTTGTTTTLYSVSFANANTGWIAGSSGTIRKTTDGGSTWSAQTSGTTSTLYGSCFIDANTGWVVGSSGVVRATTNGGTTWSAQTSNYSSTLRNIDMINANTGYLVGYSGTIRKTTDGGTNWDTLSSPFYPYVSNYGVDFIDANNGIISGANGLTLRTRDGGTTWEFENTGGYSQYGVKMTSLDSGWACSSSGYVFRYASPPVTGNNNYTHEVPANYELSQNYPNPFNPVTTIKFGLPKAGKVSLKIYDVAGRLVRTLVNNEGLNEGTFRYVFNGTDLSSGAYFYSLIVDNNLVDTKRMILIK